MSEALRFAILASGRGSNAESLMKAFASGFIPADLPLVLSNRSDAGVLQIAAAHGIETRMIDSKQMPRQAHEELVLAALQQQRIDHVLLAGYMRILTPFFLGQVKGHVLNIHPALLPDFPGTHGALRQWESGDQVCGATVHFVDEGVDTGPVLLQGSILRHEGESAEVFQQRLLVEVEHIIYPRAVRLLIDRLARTAAEAPSP